MATLHPRTTATKDGEGGKAAVLRFVAGEVLPSEALRAFSSSTITTTTNAPTTAAPLIPPTAASRCTVTLTDPFISL